MSLPLLGSLRTQTVVVLLLVLGISHVISISIYAFDRRNALAASEALDVAERTAATARLLVEIPPPLRQTVLEAMESPTFRVSATPSPQAINTDTDADADLEAVHRYLTEQLSGLDPNHIVIGTSVPEQEPAFRDIPGVDNLLRISVALQDSQWLNSTGVISRSKTLWPRPALIYILSDLVAVLAVGIWMVYRVTSPLTTFARAADRFGKDLRSQPLTETGPEEVVKAVRAFNEMQNRLQRLIENRTEMLAAISHDLRTPITVLTLRAERLKDGEDRNKLLAILSEMETMVSSVLDLAGQSFQEEPTRRVDLAAMVQSLCQDLQDTGASVSLRVPDQVLYRCRRVSLKRAITNLVENAIHYAGAAELLLDNGTAEVVIEIRDSGPGFATTDPHDLFVPFFRLERSRNRETGGTGLGLSIAKAIVESHGGTLELGNRPEGGARAVIRLPK